MELLAKVAHIFDRTINLLAVLADALIFLMMLGMSAGVVLRLYFLGLGTGEIVELSGWSLVYITFLATAWLLKREGHVKMTLLLNQLNPRNQVWLNVVTSILCAIGCLIVTFYGAKLTWQFFQAGSIMLGVLRAPKFITLAVIPIGSFLLFIQFLRRTYGYLGSQRSHQISIERG